MDFGKAPELGTIALIIVTATITALISTLMGTFGKAAAEWLLNLILRPVRFVKESLYSWVAPRNPLSISLRSYKRHVLRSNLTRIENPVGPNLEVPLEHAFAPLKLISSTTEDSVDLFAQAAASRRCIVLGGPGTGKTTLMKSLVTSVVKGRTREEALRDLIPVFVVLRNLAKREQTVEQAVVAAFADYHFPGAEKFVESALEQGKLLIILDGLDEVGAGRDFVAEQIQKFCEYDDQRARRNRLFVTCREHSYRTRDLQGVIPEVVRVEPFANHHMRVFLQGWPAYKGRTAMKLYGLIQDDPQIRDICRNPLLLTILTGLYLDTDNFELPSSRERFYKDAVDELLVHRPARRNVKQTFDADDKRQILERVALDRLETVSRHEDPEEFTREIISQKAVEVLRQDKFDPRDLIKELVEVNGIIKPGDEGSYTCAHRTIQEYFAAREARRTRETHKVVEHFGARPEFIEVLYFYCGLVDNLPALAYVVNSLVGQERWLEAGRCLLYMKEPPDLALIERVAKELHDQVFPSVEYKAALEVLSSLAQRQAPEFEPARFRLRWAVDRLTQGYGESGASVLESALATSPEAAMRIIPGLLKHHLPRWREAAVQLLRDTGTDEALDRLVLLLKDPDPVVKAHAGRTLADMLKSRPQDLRARAAFLPPRTDAAIWPLEEYFPGRLAIPIAESLGDSGWTTNEAVNCMMRALRARNDGREGRHFLKQWRAVPRDLSLRRWRHRTGRVFILSAYALSFALLLASFAAQIYAVRTYQVLVLTLTPPRVYGVEPKWLVQVRAQVKIVVADIEQRYPPNASGPSRLLPWNWAVEPLLPAGKESAYETVKNLRMELPNPHQLPAIQRDVLTLSGVASDDELAKLNLDLEAFKQHLPTMREGVYAYITPTILPVLFTSVLLLSLLFSIYWRASRDARLKKWLSPRDLTSMLGNFNRSDGIDFNVSLIMVLAIVELMHMGAGLNGSLLPRWFPFVLLLSCTGCGVFMQKLHWPNNPLIAAADDILPLEDQITQQELDEENDQRLKSVLLAAEQSESTQGHTDDSRTS
ncbi:MAG TPA: NACHT domain-containing protein [Pyrinomonadaceae bacterium]